MCNVNRIALLGTLAIAGASSAARADFFYGNFATTPGLTLVGSAVQNANRILVTPSAPGTAGAVWSSTKQSVADGFDTTMTIHIEQKNGSGSDGIALVIQNSSGTALGASGAGMGYGRNEPFNLAGIPNSFAMELDMYNNSANFSDQGGANHLSFQSRGLLQNVPDSSGTLGTNPTADLSDGSTHTVRLRYSGGFMDAFVDGSITPLLHVAVNLSTLLALDTTAACGGGAVSETRIIGRDHVVTVREPRDQVPEHLRRRRKAVQQQNDRRVRRPGLPVEHVDPVDRGRSIVDKAALEGGGRRRDTLVGNAGFVPGGNNCHLEISFVRLIASRSDGRRAIRDQRSTRIGRATASGYRARITPPLISCRSRTHGTAHPRADAGDRYEIDPTGRGTARSDPGVSSSPTGSRARRAGTSRARSEASCRRPGQGSVPVAL